MYRKTCKKNTKELYLSRQHSRRFGKGISPNQLKVFSLEDTISAEKIVRLIDAFVDASI